MFNNLDCDLTTVARPSSLKFKSSSSTNTGEIASRFGLSDMIGCRPSALVPNATVDSRLAAVKCSIWFVRCCKMNLSNF